MLVVRSEGWKDWLCTAGMGTLGVAVQTGHFGCPICTLYNPSRSAPVREDRESSDTGMEAHIRTHTVTFMVSEAGTVNCPSRTTSPRVVDRVLVL